MDVNKDPGIVLMVELLYREALSSVQQINAPAEPPSRAGP
jgi:hypothetical protein